MHRRPKERKIYDDEGLGDDEIDGRRTFSLEDKLQSSRYKGSFIKHLTGSEMTVKYMQENGFSTPILIKDKTGLGMRIPSENFQVKDVKQCVGSRRVIDVLDVNTQKGEEMTMKEWTTYFENPEREKLLNVISLEFSHTKLENYVEQPEVVRQVDWVDCMWPQHLRECQVESTNIIEKMKYPKVQRYCLMSVANCYTDFHIDMGGTSVWYHILHGKKIFWLIPPTERNLLLYEEWTLSGKQGDEFFADKMAGSCQRVELEAGWTFFIPTGWIHAVFTPADSLVFGGNFLHTFNAEMQLRVWEVESKTHVPMKFRYPFFTEIHWYTLERYVSCLTGKQHRSTAEDSPKSEIPEKKFSRIPLSPVVTTDEGSNDSKCFSDNESRKSHKSEEPMSPRSPIMEEHNYVNSPTSPQSPYSTSSRSPKPSNNLGGGGGGGSTRHHSNSSCKTPNFSQDEDSKDSSKMKDYFDQGLIKPVSLKLERLVPEANKHFKKPYVHLTPYEIGGLKTIVGWLEELPKTKRFVPKDIIDPVALLEDAKRLLVEHREDSHELAVTGEYPIKWPSRPKKPKTKTHTTTYRPKSSASKTPRESKDTSGVRRRRVRCKRCEPCTRSDCRECTYCKDMRKYGGPGVKKQTCISRQCMAPVLPNTASCLFCGKDSSDSGAGDVKEESTLMECGICWEIVHIPCFEKKHPNLDSSLGVVNEDLPSSWECPKCCDDGKQGQLKPRVMKGASIKRRDSRQSTGSDTSIDSRRDCDTPTQSENKRSSLSSSKATPVSEKISPASTRSSASTRRSRRLQEEASEEEEAATKEEEDVSNKGGIPNGRNTDENAQKDKVKRSTRSKRGRESSEERDPSPKKKAKATEAKNSPMRRSPDKSCSPDRKPGSKSPLPAFRKTTRGREAAAGENDPSNSAPGGNPGHGGSEGGPSGSAHGSGGSQPGGAGCSNPEPSGSGMKRKGPQPSPSIPVKQCQVLVHKYVVRPAPIQPPAKFVATDTGDPHPLDREKWMMVFKYLSCRDLAHCMQVCRVWYRWCLDHRLYIVLDLSRRKVKQSHLVGVVKRQPTVLDLSWTNISYRQLAWLAARLPHLKQLYLEGNSWAAASSLCSSSCPLLHVLNMKWVSGIKDACIRDLVSPPVDHRPGVDDTTSRLKQCREFSLAGSDITDASLSIIVQHLPYLKKVDLSFCTRLTDGALQVLAAEAAPTRTTLSELLLTGCSRLTDDCFDSLVALVNVRKISLQLCPSITLEGCKRFIDLAGSRNLHMPMEKQFEPI